jgi:VIT1/CCC1 family predicted Fe2+/Mn2+ transporter
MGDKPVNKGLLKDIVRFQKEEITEYFIYKRLAGSIKAAGNREILTSIAEDELKHHDFLGKYTGSKALPDKWKIFRYYWISKLFGLTFGVKLLEKGEEKAQQAYQKIAKSIPELHSIIEDEDRHEKQLIDLIEEERLQYIGSVVLGLNDALVELTGTLAGLTFALRDTRLIALAGLITGIAASLSMAASEYLSTKSDSDHSQAIKSAIYTGVAYVLTVAFLILPYLILTNYFISLMLTIAVAIIIILVFNFYVSVAKDLPFKKRFLEMASISLGVALLSFIIGYFVRLFLGIDI